MRALLVGALIIAILTVTYLPYANADILVPPQGSCQFSSSAYSPGQSIVVYVYVVTELYQPILVGQTPAGQVTVSLGDKLDPGDHSFIVGTANPPNGYRYAVLYAKSGIGNTAQGDYVQVASCSYGVVPEFGGLTTTIVLTLSIILTLILLARTKRKPPKL